MAHLGWTLIPVCKYAIPSNLRKKKTCCAIYLYLKCIIVYLNAFVPKLNSKTIIKTTQKIYKVLNFLCTWKACCKENIVIDFVLFDQKVNYTFHLF